MKQKSTVAPFIRFLKDWTLPVAIVIGTVSYLTFYYVPQLDELGTELGPVFDTLFPVFVFLTLFVTFCKVDFHQMRPHRWHTGVLVAQLLLVAINIGIILWVQDDAEQKTLWEAVLTCIIGPSAAAAPVVVGKLGGNISTMTTYTIISSVASAVMIPLVFPMLEQAVHVSFVVNGITAALGIGMDHAALCEELVPSHRGNAQPELLSLGGITVHHDRHHREEHRA